MFVFCFAHAERETERQTDNTRVPLHSFLLLCSVRRFPHALQLFSLCCTFEHPADQYGRFIVLFIQPDTSAGRRKAFETRKERSLKTKSVRTPTNKARQLHDCIGVTDFVKPPHYQPLGAACSFFFFPFLSEQLGTKHCNNITKTYTHDSLQTPTMRQETDTRTKQSQGTCMPRDSLRSPTAATQTTGSTARFALSP
mmetsp:Transcript_31781/g.62934  ORF Transcript_31781/g.62934 Transcript_31781/m.62934 type:complete len:197 (+) Transcript_31781:626-1216(+)